MSSKVIKQIRGHISKHHKGVSQFLPQIAFGDNHSWLNTCIQTSKRPTTFFTHETFRHPVVRRNFLFLGWEMLWYVETVRESEDQLLIWQRTDKTYHRDISSCVIIINTELKWNIKSAEVSNLLYIRLVQK